MENRKEELLRLNAHDDIVQADKEIKERKKQDYLSKKAPSYSFNGELVLANPDYWTFHDGWTLEEIEVERDLTTGDLPDNLPSKRGRENSPENTEEEANIGVFYEPRLLFTGFRIAIRFRSFTRNSQGRICLIRSLQIGKCAFAYKSEVIRNRLNFMYFRSFLASGIDFLILRNHNEGGPRFEISGYSIPGVYEYHGLQTFPPVIQVFPISQLMRDRIINTHRIPPHRQNWWSCVQPEEFIQNNWIGLEARFIPKPIVLSPIFRFYCNVKKHQELYEDSSEQVKCMALQLAIERACQEGFF